MTRRVCDLLPAEQEKAVSGTLLAATLGLASAREVQAAVRRERLNGAAILCNPAGGYFISDSPDEIIRFCATLEARAKRTLETAAALRRSITATTGQEVIGGFFDG